MRSSCFGKLSTPPQYLAADLPCLHVSPANVSSFEFRANKTRKSIREDILPWILSWRRARSSFASKEPTAETQDLRPNTTQDLAPLTCDLSPALKTNAVRASHPDRIVLAQCPAALPRARRGGVHRRLTFRKTFACDATRQIATAKQASQSICGTTVADGKSRRVWRTL